MIAKTIFEQVLNRAKHGPIAIIYADGTKKKYGTGKPLFTVTIHDESAISDIVKRFDLGFGEAFMHEKVTVDNLDELLKFAYLNERDFKKIFGKKSGYKFARNIRKKQAEQIESHYDLGNDFYELWLDKAMVYTCGYFRKKNDSLDTAQEQKLNHVLNKLQLSKGQEFIDLGCGWGGLVIQAAKKYGAKGIGVTLSKEQYEYAKARAKKEGVEKLTTFYHMNYQDAPTLGKTFERVVSVGMLEHVGRENHAQFFKTIDELLKPQGIAVVHSITQQTEEDMPAWIDKYIFPGGYVPSVREVVRYLPEYDFHITDYESLRMHYAHTLDEWTNRFEKNLGKVRKLGYDETFIRMWRLYLRGSATSFRYGTFDLSQFVFTKGLKNDLPSTREFLYK
ncbi:MAG TPA: cyclopropane-fatty-acyl-phospholipid synthase family protein [Candidatus Saccharimonadales bacterium]|nr:cyclopropane-fatty-acyl-phospholipid synthase family protein [Candidatus Saccharimonadales bacterium]